MSTGSLSKIYPLADVLSMHLSFDNNSKSISGKSERLLTLVDKHSTVAGVEIISSYYSSKSAGVLAHVMGDMYLFCQSTPPIGTILFHVVDGSSIMLKFDLPNLEGLLESTKTAQDAAGLVQPGIVETFVRSNNTWSVLSNGEANNIVDISKATGVKKGRK